MTMNLRDEANRIRSKMLQGKITPEQAKTELQPFLDMANKKAEVLAKKFGKKHTPFKSNSVLR